MLKNRTKLLQEIDVIKKKISNIKNGKILTAISKPVKTQATVPANSQSFWSTTLFLCTVICFIDFYVLVDFAKCPFSNRGEGYF